MPKLRSSLITSDAEKRWSQSEIAVHEELSRQFNYLWCWKALITGDLPEENAEDKRV